MNAQEELDHIARAQRDPRAFAPIYEHYVGLVWNYSLARLRDAHLAEDATSTVFLKAINGLRNYSPRLRNEQSTFRSWLMTIARNVVMDELRRRPTVPMDPIALVTPSREEGPESLIIAMDHHDRILTAFYQLSDQQQDVIRLRQQGLRGEEIAEVLGITVGAVKSTHHRAVQRLRELTDEKDESL